MRNKPGLFRAIVLCGLVVSFSRIQAQEWTLPLKVTIGKAVFQFEFGVAPRASDGFDKNLDLLTAPPPGIAPYAFLAIPVFPSFMRKDVRSNASPVEWTLQIMDLKGQKAVIEWDTKPLVAKFPKGHRLRLNGNVNMFRNRRFTLVKDGAVKINYSVPPVPADAKTAK
jgi:hypothetical protein